MTKVTFIVLLVGALQVNPTHSSLVERAKAAAGKKSSSVKVPCFNKYLIIRHRPLLCRRVHGRRQRAKPLLWARSQSNSEPDEGDDGRIKKAHPVWGVLMLTIPFLPMMVIAPLIAIDATDGKGSCTRIGVVLLAIVLSLPFTAIATPVYIPYVLGVGICGVIGCGRVGEGYKKMQGFLKTLEISLESAIQTCLGE